MMTNAEYQLVDAVSLEDFDMELQQRFAAKAQQNLRWRFLGRKSEPGTDPGRQHNYLHS